jgi:hypothetical protein
MGLWQLHQKLADAFDTDKGANAAVGRILKDFHELDKTGFNFRYATDLEGSTIKFKSGVVSLPTLKKADLAKVRYGKTAWDASGRSLSI